MKYINFNRYKLNKIFNVFNLRRYNFSRIYKHFDFRRYNFSRIYKHFDLRRYNFSRIYKHFYFRTYNLTKIYKYFNYKRYKHIPAYLFIFFTFVALAYLALPKFYNYDKSNLEKIACKEFNVKCSIKGKIQYIFFPSPRIKFEDLVIEDITNKRKLIAKIHSVEIILSIYNLHNKKKFNFIKTKFNNSKINIDLNNFSQYKKLIFKEHNLKPIIFKGGNINFIEDEKKIVSIKNINFNYKPNKNKSKGILKGDVINDKINISFIIDKKEKKSSKVFVLKLLKLGLFTKLNIINKQTDISEGISGNFLIKRGKNKLTAIFNYKDNKIIINHSNVKNNFLDGKLDGKINLLPYFDFNLNVNLNSVNFNRLHSVLISLNEKERKNLFKINKKINGNLALSVDKIFSKYTLINSIESRIKFINGNIFIEQALFGLGKIGAADLEGVIINDNKFTNLKFENNIFIDNLKQFYNKFGVYNKQKIPYSLFVSGNIDLENLILHINEISDDENFENEDVKYVEKEFNNIVMDEGYKTLFNFLKLKEFVKLITDDTN